VRSVLLRRFGLSSLVATGLLAGGCWLVAPLRTLAAGLAIGGGWMTANGLVIAGVAAVALKRRGSHPGPYALGFVAALLAALGSAAWLVFRWRPSALGVAAGVTLILVVFLYHTRLLKRQLTADAR